MENSRSGLPLDTGNLDLLDGHYSSEAKDMLRVFLREHPSAFPRVVLDDYVHDDGREEFLMKLMGGVSIVYGGGHYKLPACIILPQSFPVEGPIVYMNPNETMVRNAKSQHVDANLLVHTDYIDQWDYPFSNLCEMYEDLKAKFSDCPPLKNKTNKSASTHSMFPPMKHNDNNKNSDKDMLTEGIEAMRLSLAKKLHSVLNSRLEANYEKDKQAFLRLKDKHSDLSHGISILMNGRKELDDCISEFASTINKLDGWLEHEERKSSQYSSHDFQQHVDAYDAIVASKHRLNDMLESDACIQAVNDAIRSADEALMESKVSWHDYKKMLSQLAHYKFQAKKLYEKAVRPQKPNQIDKYSRDETNRAVPRAYPIVQTDFQDYVEEDIDLHNPLLLNTI